MPVLCQGTLAPLGRVLPLLAENQLIEALRHFAHQLGVDHLLGWPPRFQLQVQCQSCGASETQIVSNAVFQVAKNAVVLRLRTPALSKRL